MGAAGADLQRPTSAARQTSGVLDRGRRAAAERWFVRRGIPHFIEGYNAREDVLTRALPFLSLVFVLEVVLSLRPGWPAWPPVSAPPAPVPAHDPASRSAGAADRRRQ